MLLGIGICVIDCRTGFIRGFVIMMEVDHPECASSCSGEKPKPKKKLKRSKTIKSKTGKQLAKTSKKGLGSTSTPAKLSTEVTSNNESEALDPSLQSNTPSDTEQLLFADNFLGKSQFRLQDYVSNDLIEVVVDEISLEGLDGITIEALWTRISVRTLEPLPFSDDFQNTIWNIILQIEKLQFYLLPEARGKLVIFNRFKCIDWDTGHITDPDVLPDDIYPFSPISEEECGNQYFGSCAYFKTRINISEEIRQLSLGQAENKYGNKLVIIADQILRNRALGLTYAKSLDKLSNVHYCILERIGRSRKLGEVTAGKRSLLQMAGSKTLFYLRKILQDKGLITKQSFYMRNPRLGNTSALLFHLTRFYVEYKSLKMTYMEQIIDILKKKPDHRIEYMELKKLVGIDAWQRGVQKLIKSAEFRQYVHIDLMVPYRIMYPNASEKEWKVKSGPKERHLRVLQLINPSVNLSVACKDEEVKDDSSDEEPIGECALNFSIFTQCYNIVDESGAEGISLKQVQWKLGLDFYLARSVLINLVKRNLIETRNVDIRRSHILKYFIRSPDVAATPLNTAAAQATPSTSTAQASDDDTLAFIADVLEVDKNELLSANQQPSSSRSNAVEAVKNNPFKGHFEFIKEYRKKNRVERFNKKHSLELREDDAHELNDGKNIAKAEERERFESIFKNDHPYYPMKLSLEHKRMKPLKLGIQPHKEMMDIFEEISSSENDVITRPEDLSENLAITLSVADLERIKVSMPTPLKVNVLLGPTEKAASVIKQYIFLSIDVPFKTLITRFWYTLQDIQMKSNSNTLEYPRELESEDEHYQCGEKHEAMSVNVNLEEGDLGEFKEDDGEVKEFKSLLTKHFENDTCSFTESIDKTILFADGTGASKTCKRKAENEEQEDHNPKRVKQEFEIIQNQQPNPQIDEEAIMREAIAAVRMEIYMTNPVLHSHSVDEDNIETTIITTSPTESSPQSRKYTNKMLSQRTVSRANIILETIYRENIISNVPKLVKVIKTIENEKRLLGMIDRKSVDRVIHRLVQSGYIKAWKIILKYENVWRYKNILALASLDITNTVLVFRDQLKVTFFIYAKKKTDAAKPVEATDNPESSNPSSSTDLEAFAVPKGKLKYKYSRIAPREYGYVPKFAKVKILHELLFYLMYAYDGEEVSSEEVPALLNQFHSKLDEDAIKNLGTIYKRELSWKMFVPPLPNYKDWSTGKSPYLASALICDIILRIPLSIFVKIVSISYVVPELIPLLNDPIRKHVLLKNLPPDIRNACLHDRKYIFSVHEILCHLCYIGLVQFGMHKLKEKDQQYIYLNRRAILYDTTSSDPGYHHVSNKEYPILQFYFENQSIIDSYWSKLWSISMNTKLGQRYSLLDKTITLLDIHAKPDMVLSLAAKRPEVATEADIGYIPGDRLGACCFDSSTWVHVKRNWVWTNSAKRVKKIEAPNIVPIVGIRKKHFEQVKMKSIKYRDLPREMNKKKLKKGSSQPEPAAEMKTVPKKSRKFPIVRKVLPRPPSKKLKMLKYDDLDKRIMKNMGNTRAVWSEAEDVAVLICHFAKTYLCVNKRSIPPIVIRDVMHRLFPNKRRKTTSAYIRRRQKLLKSDPGNACERYSYHLECDKYLRSVFSKFRSRIANGDNIPDDHIHIAFIYLVFYVTNSYKKKSLDLQRIMDEEVHIDYLVKHDIFKYIKTKDRCSDILYQNPQTSDDIETNVIKDIAHCSLGWKLDNSDLPLMLYRAYQHYPDHLLRDAITWMRKQQIIAGKKISSKYLGGADRMPVAGNLIHNSFVYSFKQITKYPDDIYPEAYQMFAAIYSRHNVERQFYVDKFEQGHGLGLSELACFHNVLFSFKVPDDLLVLDPKMDHRQLIQELAVRYKFLIHQKRSFQEDYDQERDVPDIHENIEVIEKAIEVIFDAQKQISSTEGGKCESTNLSGFTEIEDEVQLTEVSTSAVAKEISQQDESKKESLAEKPSTSKKGFEMEANEDTLKALQDLAAHLGNKQGEDTVRISDLAYLLTKGLFPELDDDEERLEKLNRHFLILYPSSIFYVPDSIRGDPWAEDILSKGRTKADEVQEMIKAECIIKDSSHDDEVLNSMIDIGGEDDDIQLSFAIVNFIKCKGIMGASSEELKLEFLHTNRTVELHEIVSVLIKVGIVFRTGIRDFRFVHVSESRIWTIGMDVEKPISELNLNSLGMRLRLMPWVRINGTLNLKILHNWMNVIQSYCLSHPYATLISMMNRFNFLKPVDIFSLLEYLQVLDCLRMYTYVNVKPATLFSEDGIAEKRPTNILDDFESIFVETDKSAIIKLGAFKYKGQTDIDMPFEE